MMKAMMKAKKEEELKLHHPGHWDEEEEEEQNNPRSCCCCVWVLESSPQLQRCHELPFSLLAWLSWRGGVFLSCDSAEKKDEKGNHFCARETISMKSGNAKQ